MKFFIDTMSASEIRESAVLGALDDVTANPTLLAEAVAGSKRHPQRPRHPLTDAGLEQLLANWEKVEDA